VLLSMQLLKQAGASIAAEIKHELPTTRILIWGTQDSDIQDIWDCPYIDGYLPIRLMCPSLIHAIRDTTGNTLSPESRSQARIPALIPATTTGEGPPIQDCIGLIIGIAVALLLFCPYLVS